ncbi:MAG: 23S rRNA (pseudouridine(1915)-N(3))-methyltransferase RlmH [Hyphomicrobiaceae bacterium]
MRLLIAAVGKLKDGPERELFKRYQDRVNGSGKAVGLAPLDVHEIAEGRAGGREARLADEGQRLAACLRQGDFGILLDERGRIFNSRTFADLLAEVRDRGMDRTVLMIGGPDGHGSAAREVADRTFSLGAITLPHGLVRVVLAEQIYRATTILAGHPYHRD